MELIELRGTSHAFVRATGGVARLARQRDRRTMVVMHVHSHPPRDRRRPDQGLVAEVVASDLRNRVRAFRSLVAAIAPMSTGQQSCTGNDAKPRRSQVLSKMSQDAHRNSEMRKNAATENRCYR
jgi:hypothetical protein